MNLIEILKEQGITEEQAKAVMNSMKEHKIYTTTLENAEERYNKLKTQKTELDNLLKERDNQLLELSKANKGNEELSKQIKELQTSNKNQIAEYEEKINKMQFDYALDNALTKAKCRNNKAVKALLNLDELKYENGEIVGLEGQIQALKGDSDYLFETHKATGSGFNPAGNNSNKITKEDFKKMNMLQRNELYRKDPQLYEELRK